MRGYHPSDPLCELTDVDDSGPQQTVSHFALIGEQHTGVYRAQPHGFTSYPPKGSTGVMAAAGGGERSRTVFFGGEHDKYRPTGLKEGQTELYDTEKNTLLLATKDGVMLTTTTGDTALNTKAGDATYTATKKDKNKGGTITHTSDVAHVINTATHTVNASSNHDINSPTHNIFAQTNISKVLKLGSSISKLTNYVHF